MQCPTCDKTLMMTDRQGIEIDYCPECRGIWLDRGELDKLIEKTAVEPVAAQPVYRQQHHGHHPHGKRKKSLLEELLDF